MKIADETGSAEQKESATVNFGVANGSLKWQRKQQEIMQNLREIEEAREFGDEVTQAKRAFHEDDESARVASPQTDNA